MSLITPLSYQADVEIGEPTEIRLSQAHNMWCSFSFVTHFQRRGAAPAKR